MIEWSNSARKKLLTQLEGELTSLLGVNVTRSVDEFLREGAGSIRLLSAQSVLPIGHLELDPDLAVYDATNGAVGLVWLLPAGAATPAGPNASETIEHFVDRCVDDAVVLRHLCLERARANASVADALTREAGSLQQLPLSVELVLVVPDDRLASVGSALRRIVADSGYLFSIGISVLRVSAAQPANPAGVNDPALEVRDVRRAFRWMLLETEKHLRASRHGPGSGKTDGSEANAHSPGPPEMGTSKPPDWSKASRFELVNYRVSGKRRLTLQDFPATARAAPVHLVHGRNGTGKTSLVEAIELAMTGKLEFVESLVGSPGAYGRVVRNSRAPSDTCQIRVSTGQATTNGAADNATPSLVIRILDGETTFEGGCPSELEAAVCRLDQRLMDRLVKAERNEERAAILLKTLFPDDRKLLDEYEAAQKGETKRSQREQWPSEQELTSVREELTRLASWSPRGVGEARRHDRADLANDWLHTATLLEVATQDAQITELLSSVGGDRSVEPLQEWFAAPRPAAPAPHALESLQKSVRLLRAQLRPSSGHTAPEASHANETLTQGAVRAFNGVGDWIAGTSTDKLGTLLSLALEHDRTEQFADIPIGKDGWASALLARLDIATLGLHALRTRDVSTFPPIKDAERHHYAQLLRERDGLEKVLALEKTIEEQLARRIGELAEPLNEVISLLTPARWAYDDIVTKLENYKRDLSSPTSAAAGTGISFGIADVTPALPGQRGSLPEGRLNTAELNLLALAIFLLYAPLAEKNGFKLFVLDDPLQNMDELTVSCVARGLSRLQRMLPSGWRVLITVHGEENFRCLEQELYGASYSLPWLSPKDSPESAPEVITRPRAIAESAQPQTLACLCRP